MIERSAIERFMDKTTPSQPFQTDTYICKGGGTETWEQIFSYSGFRYMEVTGMTEAPTLDTFLGRFAYTDLPKAGSFSCSNPTLNKIQHATEMAYLSNAQNIFTDCPQREKNGWTGDAHLAAEAGIMNFDSVSLYEKWLNDVADAQLEDGRTSVIIPTWGWGAGTPHPAWDSAYPLIVNDLYRYTGDLTMISKHYAQLKVYVDGLASKTEKGVIPYDSLGDWLPWNTQTPSQVTSTAFLHLDATLLVKFATLLSKPEDVAKYSALAATTKKAFNDTYFDAKTGLYSNGSQAALSTALYFGLVPEDRRELTFKALVANIEKQGHIDTGIIGAKNVLRVLSEGGRTDLAYKIVARKELPGWGYWVETLGATTLFEDWKGEDSLNHIMFGDVSNWFIQWLAGIGLDPASPGFRHITIRPQPVGDLTWAKASHISPYGEITSSWTRKGEVFKLSVTIPPNCTATVALPGGTTTKVGSGKHSFESTSL
ncbi:MAG TPA: family 78 glycoside hydrolase catalytic domain, partial [Fimbriimonas sp.]|nr:family 78 glycoside hydrolase catalytic domain [Fimbriimonas sp.]